MAESSLRVEMTADERRLLNALDKVVAKEKELGRGLDSNARKSRRAQMEAEKSAAKMKQAFGRQALDAVKGLTAGIIGTGGVVAALAAANKQLDALIAKQGKAADVQRTISQTRQDVKRNLSGKSDAEIKSTLKATQDISKETGVSEKHINTAMAKALSGSGQDIAASKAAVEQAAKFIPDRPEAIAGYAGSLLDLSKVTGTTDARVNMGLLTQVGALSRVDDPQKQAMNIPKALIGMKGLGATAPESAALFGALSEAGADISGEMTGTATISFAEQMREFFQSGKGKQMGAWFQGTRGRSMTMGERIRALQSNQGLAQQFLEGASFEKKTQVPIEELLTDPESVAAQRFTKNLGQIPGNKGLAKLSDTTIRQLRSREIDPLAQTFQTERELEQTVEAMQTKQTRGGRIATVRKQMNAALDSADVWGFDKVVPQWGFELATGLGVAPEAAASGFLRGRARDLVAPMKNPLEAMSPIPTPNVPSGEDMTNAQAMLRMANLLEKQLEIMEKQDRREGSKPAQPNRNSGL